jgi:hypothetical protein
VAAGHAHDACIGTVEHPEASGQGGRQVKAQEGARRYRNGVPGVARGRCGAGGWGQAIKGPYKWGRGKGSPWTPLKAGVRVAPSSSAQGVWFISMRARAQVLRSRQVCVWFRYLEKEYARSRHESVKAGHAPSAGSDARDVLPGEALSQGLGGAVGPHGVTAPQQSGHVLAPRPAITQHATAVVPPHISAPRPHSACARTQQLQHGPHSTRDNHHQSLGTGGHACPGSQRSFSLTLQWSA